MCGICGAVPDPAGSVAEAMSARLVHRGPDDGGVWVDPGSSASIAARRLSIQDIAGGHQPLGNEDGTICAVLNGEIYNFRELREQLAAAGHRFATSCDTEVLVHLYEEIGADLVHALDGMFAFAVLDSRRRRLLLARDRFGEKPLFYAQQGAAFTFASELRALEASGRIDAAVDPSAVDAYFVLGYVPAPRTMRPNASQLLPGHVLDFDLDTAGLRVSRYWQPPRPERRPAAPHAGTVDELDWLVRRSMRGRVSADVPVGVFLSGGLDSALVASYAAEAMSGSLPTFTVGYDVGAVNELVEARKISQRIGSEHHELVLDSATVATVAQEVLSGMDQPLADQALVASHAIARDARRHVTVAVGGEGADELFGGYPRYGWLRRAEAIGTLVPGRVATTGSTALGALRLGGRARRFERVLRPEGSQRRNLAWISEDRLDMRAAFYGPRLRDHVAPPQDLLPVDVRFDAGLSAMLIDQTQWLPDDVLTKADRSSMLASLEVRTPFLTREIAELAASVSLDVHLRNGGKFLLRALHARRYPRLGSPRKRAFRVPAADWLRRPLRASLAEVLDGPLCVEGWLDRTAVKRAIHAHNVGCADRSAVLWPILALHVWMTAR